MHFTTHLDTPRNKWIKRRSKSDKGGTKTGSKREEPAAVFSTTEYLGYGKGSEAMDERLQKIFDSVPADEPRSRLEPYRELILRWRRQGRTYHRIRQLLAEQCDVKVAYVTLYRFIQRRSRPQNRSSTGSPAGHHYAGCAR